MKTPENTRLSHSNTNKQALAPEVALTFNGTFASTTTAAQPKTRVDLELK